MQALFNDFFSWNLQKNRGVFDHPRLTDDEHDELFLLYNDSALPETAMRSMEMVDGFLTACIVGPELPATHVWLEDIFGQPHLPICADATAQERLLHLLVRRYMDISESLQIKREALTVDNVYMPLLGEMEDPSDCIRPYQLDVDGQRLGDWEYKDWAAGFQFAVATDALWEAIFEDGESGHYLGPIVIAQMGYNPDNLDFQYEDSTELPALIATLPYSLREFWRAYNRRAVLQTPYLRDIAKIGRNDPCVCDSGKKYKKCCGA